MGITATFWRSVNLFRGSEVRAVSPHTSLRGLNNIVRKTPEFNFLVAANLENQLQAGKLTVKELIRIVVEESPNLSQPASVIIIKNPNLYHEAAGIMIPLLNHDLYESKMTDTDRVKAIPARGLGFGARFEAAVYRVTRDYPVRKWAREILTAIAEKTNSGRLRFEISRALDSAPPVTEDGGEFVDSYQYRDKQVDHEK